MTKPQTTPRPTFVEAIDGLLNAVEKAAKQFSFYEEQHMAKNPPDVAKAKTNHDYAVMCYEALSAWEAAENDR